MALINCKECGHKISDTANVCPNCGAPQNTREKQQKEQIAKTNLKSFFVIGIIVSIICILIAIANAPGGSIQEQNMNVLFTFASIFSVIATIVIGIKRRK